jgi:hypothetical protein
MRHYIVTYTDPNAPYPAPKQTTEIAASTRAIWDQALRLGVVHKIYEIGGAGAVFSIHWDHNFLGLTPEQVAKNLEF